MALRGKYAALPDIDSAPDIYETPELTDDNSTVPGTTLRSGSDDGYDDDVGDEDTGISRSKLRIDDARSRFDSTRYNASGVDFSGRVDGKRKSYKETTRRRRLEDGTEEYGDLSDDDDAESLERKIARLKREVEEAKEEYEKRKAASKESKDGGEEEEEEEDGLVSLGQALEEIALPLGHTVGAGSMRTVKPAAESATTPGAVLDEPTYTVTYAPSYEQTHALVKTAEFDNRLLLLEKAIGATAAGIDMDLNGLPRAIVPTLDTLQKQISTLSQASTATLDSISRRVRALTQEAEQLTRARKDAKDAREALESGGERAEGERDSDEQDAKINALYGTLTTIENLAPLLPPLLDRLRSLRDIHAHAATASETLDRIEKQQTETATELKQWREGLEKIEGAMKQSDSVMSGNMNVMESWVKDLEGRMAKLS